MKQISQDEFQLLAKALGWKNFKCKFCKKKITKKNFGVIHADVYSCKEISCQVFAINELELKHKLK